MLLSTGPSAAVSAGQALQVRSYYVHGIDGVLTLFCHSLRGWLHMHSSQPILLSMSLNSQGRPAHREFHEASVYTIPCIVFRNNLSVECCTKSRVVQYLVGCQSALHWVLR